MLLKLENLEKENREIREKIAEGKVEAGALGLDTLAKAIDKARKGDLPGVVCTTCANKFVTVAFRVYVADTILRETQTESWEADTQKLFEDIVVTQEPAIDTMQST